MWEISLTVWSSNQGRSILLRLIEWFLAIHSGLFDRVIEDGAFLTIRSSEETKEILFVDTDASWPASIETLLSLCLLVPPIITLVPPLQFSNSTTSSLHLPYQSIHESLQFSRYLFHFPFLSKTFHKFICFLHHSIS